MKRQQSVGLRIKQAREELRLSQEELGKIVGWSDANISRIEKRLRSWVRAVKNA